MKKWKWVESTVDCSNHHILITYGEISSKPAGPMTSVALVGPPSESIFPVQFLLSGRTRIERAMIKNVKEELDYFLVEINPQNRWEYALYHCTTAANVYSPVHWNEVFRTKSKYRI